MLGVVLRSFALLAAVLIVLHGRTRAYLDPGSGSLATQMLIAGLAGAIYVLKTRWRRLKRFLSRRREPEPSLEVPGDTDARDRR